VADLSWHMALNENEIGEVQALMAAATDVDGTAPLSEHVLMHLRRGGDAEAVRLMVRDGSGALVAFAHLDATDPVAGGAGELVVHPESRRHGLGEQVVQALLDRMAEAGSPAGGRLRLWAYGEHPGAAALAQRHGFSRSRVLWQMRRSLLAPLAAPQFPADVRLRTFVVGADEPEFLRVNNAAFDWHPEQGGWDADQMKLREAEPWFDPAGRGPASGVPLDEGARCGRGRAREGWAQPRADRRDLRPRRGPVRAGKAPRERAHPRGAASSPGPWPEPGDAVRRG